MIIGFDASQTGEGKAGCGYYAEGLIAQLAELDSENTYILYPTFGDGVWDPCWPQTPPPVRGPNVRQGLGHRTRAELETFWRSPTLDEDQLGRPDVIHTHNFYCPRGLRHARVVYTLHDLAFLEHPEWTTEANRINCFSGTFNASLYADRIVAVSDYTRQHFLRTFPHYPPERIAVIYSGSRFTQRSIEDRPASLPDLRPDGFWLTVGTFEPRKNHRRLLLAYARLKARLGHVLPLVLAGGKGWLMDDFEHTLDELQLRQDVLVLGYVEDRALQWLYTHCFGFLYVSLFEGFGLPVVEAMSCGAAVISSNTTSLPELVADAGLMVDPLDENDIADAMVGVATGAVERPSLKGQAAARAHQFSWRGAAAQVRAVYEELAAEAPIGHPSSAA
jgi:glycosyltransferase involved in cell wall biosynthesis